VKRVVLVAYYYPPLGGIGSQRMLGFASHLPTYGWAADVVAPTEGTYGVDRGLPVDLPPPGRVWRCVSPEPATLLKRALGRGGSGGTAGTAGTAGSGGIVEEASLQGVAARLRAFIRRWAYVPDGQLFWIPFAVATALRASRGADAILSSSPPVSGHLVAAIVARITGLPWFADFRDLWTPHERQVGVRQRVDVAIERRLLRAATAFTTVSEGVREVLASLAGRPASDVEVIPNGFETSDFGARPRRAPGAFTLTHTGTVHGRNQNLTTLLDVLVELFRAGRIDRARFRLRFVGQLDGWTRSVVQARGLTDVVVDEGFRGHAEAVAAQEDATALLLLVWKGDGPVRAGVRPGKLPEYLAAGRPILALGDPGGEAAGVVARAAAGTTVAFDDRDGLANALVDRWDAWARDGDLEPIAPSAERDAHERAGLAGRLARFLDRRLAD